MDAIPSWVPYTLLSVAVVVLTYLATRPPAQEPKVEDDEPTQRKTPLIPRKTEPPPPPDFNPLYVAPQILISREPTTPVKFEATRPKSPRLQSPRLSQSAPRPQSPRSPRLAVDPQAYSPEKVPSEPSPPPTTKSDPKPIIDTPETVSTKTKEPESPVIPAFTADKIKPKPGPKKVDLASLFDQLKDSQEKPREPSGSDDSRSSSDSDSNEGTSPPLDTSDLKIESGLDLLAGLNALKGLDPSNSSSSGSGSSASSAASGEDSDSHHSSDSQSESDEEKDQKLIKGFAAVDDINKAGLTRAKKFTTVKGKKIIQMEDTHYVASPFQNDEDVSLFCVFDGHGGLICSEELVKSFPAVFVKHWNALENPKDCDDFTALWREVYNEVDLQLKEIEDCHFCGSTCTTVLVWKSSDGKRRVQSANVGDSSAFIFVDGQSVMLSVDHKVTDESERERLVDSGVTLAPHQTRLTGGLALARALGDHFLKDEEKKTGLIAVPHISKPLVITKAVKQLVVASDGLYDIVPGRNLFKIINPQMEPEQAAKKLLTTAVSSTQCDDNVTVIVVNF